MKNVHRKGPSLYYVKNKKWTRLCSADAPEHEIHRAMWRILSDGAGTLSAVMDDYRIHKLPKLAPATQRDYERIIKTVLMPIFGHMIPGDLTSQDIAAYLYKREKEGKAPAGNREMAVLSSVMAHGMRIRACNINPCYGVRRNRENARTMAVTDRELRDGLRRSTPAFRRLLWGLYLTGYRQKDIMAARPEQCLPEGLVIRQSKDGKHELREWTDSLRRLVRKEIERSRCNRIFSNTRGEPWTQSAIQSAMTRLNVRWTLHDLRAKADSDHETGLGLMRRYNRARRLRAVK